MGTASIEFSIESLRKSMPEIMAIVDSGEPFAIHIEKTHTNITRVRQFLTALDGGPDIRSPLRATMDAWRIRDIVTIFGLASDRKYNRSAIDNANGMLISFKKTIEVDD
jgi:hypothetical protein